MNFLGTEFESVTVNELSVFELLTFYCSVLVCSLNQVSERPIAAGTVHAEGEYTHLGV